ncbi:MAG: AmmeMemoRadiSam system protein B [Acidobacteria bacterium]|nr:AmmeMemoRadiSam system protein B [Acidobacteriota bacterium]
MPQTLAALRADLEVMPSPDEERPGLLLRDGRYTGMALLIPPPLVGMLGFFDGEHSERDLKDAAFQMSGGDLGAGEVVGQLAEALDEAGFLENERFQALRDEIHEAFAATPERLPAHAGAAYPEEPEELGGTMRRYMDRAAAPEISSLCAIAAPHVSPEGGWESYRDAYAALTREMRDDVFVILGTSHSGEPDRFGLTRKNYITPLGAARTEVALVDELAQAAGDGVIMEDFAHAYEHTVEFQVLFLQHLLGAGVRVVPVMVGSFARSVYLGQGMPEDQPGTTRFFDALGNMAAREGRRLKFILGVDLAHIGRRYQDEEPAFENQGRMLEIAEQDRRRLAAIAGGDASGYWDMVRRNQDDLNWCGSSALYTFLKAMPHAKGSVARYQQWQIDPESVVSFTAMHFRSF